LLQIAKSRCGERGDAHDFDIVQQLRFGKIVRRGGDDADAIAQIARRDGCERCRAAKRVTPVGVFVAGKMSNDDKVGDQGKGQASS